MVFQDRVGLVARINRRSGRTGVIVDRFSAAVRAVFEDIVGADQAWSRRDDVERRHGAQVVAELVAGGFLVVWDRPDYQGVCLSPVGAYLRRVDVAERWAYQPAGRDGAAEPGMGVAGVPLFEEVGEWHCEGVRPFRLPERRPAPKFSREVMMSLPDRVCDPSPGPLEQMILEEEMRLFLDAESGKPVKLFAGPDGTGGVTVAIDRRLKAKAKKKKAVRT